jgi:hypothetical protein
MEIGDYVAVYASQNQGEKIVATATIVEVTSRIYRVKVRKPYTHRWSGAYLRSSLMMRGSSAYRIVSISPERAVQLDKEIEEREEAERNKRYADEQKERQAAYDALPENVKFARKLRWFCEMNREETIAQAPLEAIRAIVEWAIANNKEVD